MLSQLACVPSRAKHRVVTTHDAVGVHIVYHNLNCLSEISGSRSATNWMGSYSSLRPSRMRSKRRASVKLSPVCLSSSRCWITSESYSSGSCSGLVTMPFSLRMRIRRHCNDEMRYFSAIFFHAACPSGWCLESDLPSKRKRKLLTALLVDDNRTL